MKRIQAVFLLLSMTVLLTACGTIPITSVAPSIALESVEVDDQDLILNLLIENRNDNTIFLTSAQLALFLEDTLVFDVIWSTSLDISPRGRESIIVSVEAEPAGIEALQSIKTSGAYQLEGELEFESLNKHSVEVRGFLHPVPGQAGRYR